MAVYSFIYKEIIVPKSAPINISLNLSLQKSGTSDDRVAKFKKPIDAILLKIGAKNPSSRSVCLLPSYFIAYGYKMSDNHLSDERFVKGAGDNPIVYKEGVFLTKHLTVAKTSVVALGNLIEDEVLKPNEQVENSYIFYTPQGEYDFIEVFAAIPSVSMKARGKIGLKRDFDKKISGFQPTMFRISADGKKEPLEKDKDGTYSDESIDLQTSRSRSEISLWQ